MEKKEANCNFPLERSIITRHNHDSIVLFGWHCGDATTMATTTTVMIVVIIIIWVHNPDANRSRARGLAVVAGALRNDTTDSDW